MTDEKEKDIYKFFFTNNLNTDYLKTGSQIFILLNFMYNFEEKKNNIFHYFHPYFKQPGESRQKSF